MGRLNKPPVLVDLGKSNVVVCVQTMKDTTVSFKIQRELKAKLVTLARAENRSLSNFIEKVLKEEIAKHERKHGRMKKR
jgi:hypothetical protein